MKFKISLIITLALICVVAACFTGCDSSDTQTTIIDTTISDSDTTISTDSDAPTKNEWGMEELGSMSPRGNIDDTVVYYRDIRTDVMYIFFSRYSKGGPTVMYDPETGLPLTYTRYKELYK